MIEQNNLERELDRRPEVFLDSELEFDRLGCLVQIAVFVSVIFVTLYIVFLSQ